MLQGELSTILSTFIKLPFVIKIFACLFLVVAFKRQFLPCADPENFARGGPTLTMFFLMRAERIQIALKEEGHQRPASETPFEWRFAGGPMMAQH